MRYHTPRRGLLGLEQGGGRFPGAPESRREGQLSPLLAGAQRVVSSQGRHSRPERNRGELKRDIWLQNVFSFLFWQYLYFPHNLDKVKVSLHFYGLN